MRKPKKLSSEDLQHPKGQQKAWNGDVRQPRSSRFNGDAEFSDRGFMSRGVHSVTPPIASEPAPGSLRKPPSSIHYERPYSHLTDAQKVAYNRELRDNAPEVISLTDRQRKMTYGRGK